MRQTHERFVLMRRILSYFYDLCVFTFPRVQCWLPCVSLTSLDPWYLTPVSPSLSPGPLWFLPSFMDRTPTWLRASLMVPVSSVCGLLPPPPFIWILYLFFSSISSKTVSQIKASTHYPSAPPPSPHPPIFSHRSALSLWWWWGGVDSPECYWTRPSCAVCCDSGSGRCLAPSLGLFSLLYWLPVSVSRTDSLRCFNIKMLDAEKWNRETDLWGGGLEGL